MTEEETRKLLRKLPTALESQLLLSARQVQPPLLHDLLSHRNLALPTLPLSKLNLPISISNSVSEEEMSDSTRQSSERFIVTNSSNLLDSDETSGTASTTFDSAKSKEKLDLMKMMETLSKLVVEGKDQSSRTCQLRSLPILNKPRSSNSSTSFEMFRQITEKLVKVKELDSQLPLSSIRNSQRNSIVNSKNP